MSETYTQCQILFCYTDGFIYAGRDITVLRKSFFNSYTDTAPADVGIWYNLSSQTLSIITRSRIARHGYVAPALI